MIFLPPPKEPWNRSTIRGARQQPDSSFQTSETATQETEICVEVYVEVYIEAGDAAVRRTRCPIGALFSAPARLRPFFPS